MVTTSRVRFSRAGDRLVSMVGRIRAREDQLFLVLTLVIGALAGLTVVAFILLTDRLGGQLFPPGGSMWNRLLIPVAGALGMGLLLHAYFPDARGSGVPQTKAALYARAGFISFRTVVGKFICTSATLACGIPLGREGPAVQVGGGIASVVGRAVGLSPERIKALVPVGAAAAIAAAFNTPVAAVLFALEEVLGDLHAPLLGSVVLSSATSWIVLHLLLGDAPLFQVPQYELTHPAELFVYAVLGVLGGVAAAAFVKMLLAVRASFSGLPRRTRWLQPVAGGVVVGVVALFVPEVLGVGYGHVDQALNGGMSVSLMGLLLVLKLAIVPICYGSGNAGGIFGPSLFIGAMLGGAVGSFAHQMLPAYTSSPGAYALVGMGALFAGIVRAPLTSVIMIFEVTRDYAIIVPLMIANLVSFFISRSLQHLPIYEALALQDGVRLPGPRTARQESGFLVSDAISEKPLMLDGQLGAEDALEQAREPRLQAVCVGSAGRFEGIVRIATIEKALTSHELRGARLVRLIQRPYPYVHEDDSLHVALVRMGKTGLDMLPVVSRADVHTLVGVITRRDVFRAYGVEPGSD